RSPGQREGGKNSTAVWTCEPDAILISAFCERVSVSHGFPLARQASKSSLFVPQRHHRIDLRCPPRREVTGKQGNSRQQPCDNAEHPRIVRSYIVEESGKQAGKAH